MGTLRHLLVKEVLQIRRNSFLPRLILIFPVMIMCVMPWVMDMEVDNVNVVVVDNDHSQLSRRLVERVASNPHFRFRGVLPGYGDALSFVERDKADVIMEIPLHYERDFSRGKVPHVLVAANAVNGTKGSLGSSYASQIVVQHALSSAHRPVAAAQSVRLSTLNLYNPHLSYKRFMIPALMSILIMMMCGFLPALNIVGEKEAGTIEQVNVTPVSKFAFIFAKLIPYWCIGLFVLTVCLLLSWLIYGITPVGSLWLVYMVSVLLALVFSGLGLVVSNHSDTMQQAIFVMWFFVVCMMLLSGLFTPISSMPQWAQNLTRVIPVRYYIDAMRTVFLRGGTFSDILPSTLALVLFALILDVWAVISYRKRG